MRKGADDPAERLPPNDSDRCDYVEQWVGIKRKRGLSMDPAEERAV